MPYQCRELRFSVKIGKIKLQYLTYNSIKQ
jgi:hypothetical protein